MLPLFSNLASLTFSLFPHYSCTHLRMILLLHELSVSFLDPFPGSCQVIFLKCKSVPNTLLMKFTLIRFLLTLNTPRAPPVMYLIEALVDQYIHSVVSHITQIPPNLNIMWQKAGLTVPSPQENLRDSSSHSATPESISLFCMVINDYRHGSVLICWRKQKGSSG